MYLDESGMQLNGKSTGYHITFRHQKHLSAQGGMQLILKTTALQQH